MKSDSEVQLAAQDKDESLAKQFVASYNLGRDIASPMEGVQQHFPSCQSAQQTS